MAVSGMDYGKMATLVEEANEIKTAVNEKLQSMIDTLPTRVGEYYGGDAASDTKTKLVSVATNINTAITDIINSLNSSAEQKKADYAHQEAKMQGSVGGGSSAPAGGSGNVNVVQ